MPWPTDRPFRILSIDGGGIKGILPAAILAKLEAQLPGSQGLANHFDLITGTSTGGIIALGLSLGVPASTILELYLEKGGSIFPSLPQPFRHPCRWIGGITQFFYRRYNPFILDHELAKILGGKKFGGAQCRLVIPAFDHNTEPCVFKTPHHPDYRLDWSEDALTVARATSAAPTYLEGLENAGRLFWDGGIFANNPVMMGLIDALVCFDVDRRNIEIVSLGCATDRPKLMKKHLKAGMLEWRNAHAVASSLQSHDSLGQAGLLIGRDRLKRIDADLPYSIAMDDYHKAKTVLPEVAELLWRHNQEDLMRIAQTVSAPYEPFYGSKVMNGSNSQNNGGAREA